MSAATSRGRGGPSVRSRGKGGGKGKGGGGGAAGGAARALNAELARASRDQILALVVERHQAFNSVNCATALHRLAKATPTEPKLGGTDAHWKRSWGAAAKAAEAGGAQDAREAESLLCARTAVVLRADDEAVTARSLTSIAWAVGRLGLSDAGLLDAIAAQATAQLEARALDAYGIANVAWALATLHASAAGASVETVEPPHPALLDALAEAACATPDAFNPQETTNLLWAFATLGRRHSLLFERLTEAAARRMGDFTPQGLSQTLWACAKLNLAKHALLLSAAAAALPKLRTYDAQSVATVAWAFASLEVEHGPLLAAVCREAARRPEAFDSASCSQLLWALSRLRDGVEPAALTAMAARLSSVASTSRLQSQQLLYALGALAKLPTGPPSEKGKQGDAASLPALLCAAAAAAAPGLTANKLGIAAWALARPAVLRQVPAAEAAAWRAALRARCAQVAEHLHWRTIGHVELALRLLHAKLDAADAEGGAGLDEEDELVRLLDREAARSVAAASERSARLNAAPAALLLRSAPWATADLPPGSRLLLAGFDPDTPLDAALTSAGLKPIHWRRFAASSNDAAAAAWPEEELGCVGAAVRWPWYAAGDAAAMLLHAVAAALPAGAPLWIVGNADEGAEGVPAAAAACFGEAALLHQAEGALLHAATRGDAGRVAAASERGRLDGWLSASTLRLPGAPAGLPWMVYPGLFAGGGLDIMTAALLRSLPPPPRARAAVLDACCGSGAIGAALLARHPKLEIQLHLLDADAVALAAARDNVPAAARTLLCSEWPDTAAFPERAAKGKAPLRYDWIVSNPPVHRGQPDCFDVVVALIRGARARLRPDGVLWMVAQEQVPMGRLLWIHGSFSWVRASVSEDGRFVTWSAGGSRGGGPVAEEGEEQPAHGTERRKKSKRERGEADCSTDACEALKKARKEKKKKKKDRAAKGEGGDGRGKKEKRAERSK